MSNRLHHSQKLRILNVAYPLMPVIPGSGGGAEQILRVVERGLVEAGYHSIVVAAAGSQVSGTLIESPAPNGTMTEEVRRSARKRHKQLIETAIREQTIDLVHYHGLDFLEYRPHGSCIRELATLHLPVDWYPQGLFNVPKMAFNFVSHSQARTDTGGTTFPVIPNGIELDRYYVAQRNEGYLLWLGRICPEKGTAIALRIAHRLKTRLLVAGPVHQFAAHRTYFEEQVQLHLDASREYKGTVAGVEKAGLLSRARCLLVPSLARETSSLVAMEAIASGTPVIAFRTGALPEIVEHGVTGFLVDSEDAMASAVSQVDGLDRATIRAHAEAHFSSDVMIRRYLALYQQLIDSFRH